MTVNLYDTFNGETQLTGYDAPIEYGTTGLDAILANDHIDLRVFDQTALTRGRMQSEIDGIPQTVLDTYTQTFLDTVTVLPGEAWTNPVATGVSSFTVGAISSRNDWRGLVATLSGALNATTFLSTMGSAGAIDIGSMTYLSLVTILSGTGTLDLANCTIQLDTSTLGDFSNANFVSSIVAFSAGTSSELRVTLAALAAGSGAQFASNYAIGEVPVSGVKIKFKTSAAPTAGDTLTLMGLRAYDTGYDPSWGVDVNTRENAVMVPVTFTGSAPANTSPPLVRGTITQASDDPQPEDASSRMAIRLGALANGSYSTIDLLFRETRSALSGQFTRVRFQLRGADAKVQADIVNWNGTTETLVNTVPSTAIPGGTWTATKATGFVMLEVELVANQITINLRNTDNVGSYGSAVFTLTQHSTSLVQNRGRLGWGISLLDRDIALVDFNAFGTSFATLISKVYESLTPVSSVQLTASFAQDTNLFSTFYPTYGVVLELDNQKTLGAASSFKSTGPIVSNTFRLDDVGHTYIEFDLWVPDTVTPTNQPSIVLRSQEIIGGSPSKVTFPPLILQGNQWNHVYVELATSSGIIPALNYQLFLESGNSFGTSYEWNVTNVIVGRRNVAWSAKSQVASGNWYEFREIINDALGRLHFPHDERGFELQIKAEAISEEAWISSYTVAPVYAELGRAHYSH